MGIKSSQRGNKKKLGYFLIETKPLIFATTRRRVCCVYVKTDRIPFIYWDFRVFSCTFE